jgi:hypothetical protein
MGKVEKEKMLQAIACLTCTAILWIHFDDLALQSSVAVASPGHEVKQNIIYALTGTGHVFALRHPKFETIRLGSLEA